MFQKKIYKYLEANSIQAIQGSIRLSTTRSTLISNVLTNFSNKLSVRRVGGYAQVFDCYTTFRVAGNTPIFTNTTRDPVEFQDTTSPNLTQG
jgi:hypothetical protein